MLLGILKLTARKWCFLLLLCCSWAIVMWRLCWFSAGSVLWLAVQAEVIKIRLIFCFYCLLWEFYKNLEKNWPIEHSAWITNPPDFSNPMIKIKIREFGSCFKLLWFSMAKYSNISCFAPPELKSLQISQQSLNWSYIPPLWRLRHEVGRWSKKNGSFNHLCLQLASQRSTPPTSLTFQQGGEMGAILAVGSSSSRPTTRDCVTRGKHGFNTPPPWVGEGGVSKF